MLISIVTTWTITFFVTYFAACGTRISARVGTIGDLKTECVNTFVLVVAMTATDVVVDLIILVLPVPLVSGSLRTYAQNN